MLTKALKMTAILQLSSDRFYATIEHRK